MWYYFKVHVKKHVVIGRVPTSVYIILCSSHAEGDLDLLDSKV